MYFYIFDSETYKLARKEVFDMRPASQSLQLKKVSLVKSTDTSLLFMYKANRFIHVYNQMMSPLDGKKVDEACLHCHHNEK